MPDPAGLAFKAYEIEELADVYFFRPLGMLVARVARALHLTPTTVTLVGTVVGLAGGLLIVNDRYGLVGFGLLIVHSILDSSDGQLARMTGRTSELGRVLDGASGYVTHAAIYMALLAQALVHDAAGSAFAIIFAAAVSNIVHAQMYDYYRASYAASAIDGTPVVGSTPPRSRVLRVYEAIQRVLAGRHSAVEAVVAARARNGVVSDADRSRYRRFFYATVRGWNAMGDNTRFYALGVLAWLHRVEWFPLFVLVAMNAAFAVLWLWQARADRRFLATL